MPSFFLYKLSKQIVFILIWVSQGLGQIVGPSIPDLKASLGYTFEEISGCLSLYNIAAIVGALIGGGFHDYFPRYSEVFMAVVTILSALAAAFLPMAYPLSVMALCCFIMGISCNVLNTGVMPIVLEMWGGQASSPMHALHFGYGLGAIVSPLIVRPFLTELPTDTSPANPSIFTTDATLATEVSTQVNNSHYLNETAVSYKLMYPYAITSGITIFTAILLGLFGICRVPKGFPAIKQRTSLKKLLTPSSCYPGSPGYSTIILLFLFLYFFHACAVEHTYGTFIFTYVVESDLQFEKSKAAVLNSVYWGSFVVGRFSGILIGYKIPPQYMIGGCLVTSLLTSISILLFSQMSEYVIWPLIILAGYTNSLLFASGMLWGKKYITMNAMATMICVAGAALGVACYFYMTGLLFDTAGFQSFGYILTFLAGSYIIIFFVMQLYVHKFGRVAPDRLCQHNDNYRPVREKEGCSDEDHDIESNL